MVQKQANMINETYGIQLIMNASKFSAVA